MRAAVPYVRGRVLDFGCGDGEVAAWRRPEEYVGVDRDPAALAMARARFPTHRFEPEIPRHEQFDTVLALAVIEHLPCPEAWLRQAASILHPEGSVVLTTPHPAFRRIHDYGAALGIFSHAASEEHESFLGHDRLRALAKACGFHLVRYRRFLLGANQLVVLGRELPVGRRPNNDST